MYVPRPHTVDDDEQLRALVTDSHLGTLITSSADGTPQATVLPVLWRDDLVIAHLAVANEHWRTIVDGSPGLVLVTGRDAYVSPSWYASKTEHGRVVPTWNYSAVELRGSVHVHRDPEWLRWAVGELTDHHESSRSGWQVDDAPAEYVDQQLRAIVGVELRVTSTTGKAKWSQNKDEADRDGVRAGLSAEGRSDEAGLIP